MDRRIGDQELYPALLATLAALGIAYCIWRWGLEAPAFPVCQVWAQWRLYCPACGGTRAMEALLRGRIWEALYWNPAVPVGAASVAVYLASQTVWRLRRRQGPVLRWSRRWLWLFLGLLAANCLLRNGLWRLGGIPL